MADIDVVDLSTPLLSDEEERRRWAAQEAVKVVCAAVAAQGPSFIAAIDFALDRLATALDAYARDGTIIRDSPNST